jgi:hypothetical protein
MRFSTVITKVRPIKKLFIIEKNSLAQLLDIVAEISTDISPIYNLFLVNDQNIFSENTCLFVKRHDPDVIFNFSALPESELYQRFRTYIVKPDKHLTIARFSSGMQFFTNIPFDKIHIGGRTTKREVFACFESAVSDIAVMKSINFGLLNKINDRDEYLKHWDLKISEPAEIQIPEVLLEKNYNYLYLSSEISASSLSSGSIYEINNNQERYFDNKEIVAVIGSAKDINGIVYFWNVRATFPFTNIIWIPTELVDTFKEVIRSIENLVFIGDDAKSKILNLNVKFKEIPSLIYSFAGYHDDWKIYEHIQNIPIEQNEFKIFHPIDKMFSDMGFGGAFILEIRGLQETLFPPNLKLGKQFAPDRMIGFPEYFTRISQKGLSSYCFEFDPYSTLGLAQRFKLPAIDDLLITYFNDFDINIIEKEKSTLIKQLISLVGGLSGLSLITDEKIFNLLVRLTPKRIERLVKDISSSLGKEIDSEEMANVLSQNLDPSQSINSEVIVDIEKIHNIMGLKKEEKIAYADKIQALYNGNILLRGKYFECQSCKTKIWLSLERIERKNICYCCNNIVEIPISEKGNAIGDHYRLNELVGKAIDQGQLATLLTLKFLEDQQFGSRNYLFNLDVVDQNKIVITDIDILVKLWKKIGLAETKAHRGFDEKQVEDIITVATKVRADFVIFSSIKSKSDPETNELFKKLRSMMLTMPAFILTSETLFNKKATGLLKYFEVHANNRLPSGPIILD